MFLKKKEEFHLMDGSLPFCIGVGGGSCPLYAAIIDCSGTEDCWSGPSRNRGNQRCHSAPRGPLNRRRNFFFKTPTRRKEEAPRISQTDDDGGRRKLHLLPTPKRPAPEPRLEESWREFRNPYKEPEQLWKLLGLRDNSGP